MKTYLFAGVKFNEILFTQCRASVGVLKPSPLNTWPKCPPHAVQVISTRLPSLSRCIQPNTSLCYSGTIYSRCTPIAETQQQQQEKSTTKSFTKVCKHPSIHITTAKESPCTKDKPSLSMYRKYSVSSGHAAARGVSSHIPTFYYNLQTGKFSFNNLFSCKHLQEEEKEKKKKFFLVQAAYCFCDGTRKAFKESRPATAGIKFGCRLVQWSSTCSTLVQSIFLVLVILPCSCPSDDIHIDSTRISPQRREHQSTTKKSRPSDNPKPKQIDAWSSQDEPSLLLLSSQGLCMLRSYQRGTFQEENIRPRVSTCKGKESIAKFIHTGTRERERKREYSLGAFLTKDAELLRTKHGSPFLLSLLHRCSRGCG